MTPSPDFTWLFFKMIAGLVLVVGLAVFLLKYLLPKIRIGRRSRQPAWATVIDRIPLGPHTQLSLVKIAGRYFVLGTSEQSVNLIAEIPQSEGDKIE